MKGNTPGFLLLGLTLVSAVFTVYLSWATVRSMTVQHSLSAQMESVQSRRLEAAALLKDVYEYSRKNPAVVPLLQQFGLDPEKFTAK